MITLDIRWPLGLIFSVVGAILVGYAASTDADHGLGSGLNAPWGALMLLFGGSMLALAWRAAGRVSR